MRSLFGAVSVVLLGVSLFGCAEADTSDTVDLADAPALETRGGRGSTGSNGLATDVFQNLKVAIAKAAQLYPLVKSPGSSELNPNIVDLVLAQPDGDKMLTYAVACAVPDKEYIQSPGGTFSWVGYGHLKSGSAWLTSPLPPEGVDQLLACIALHVNAFGKTVPILLLGSLVQDDPDVPDDYNYPEAFWKAKVNSDGMSMITVWPSHQIYDLCDSDPQSAFEWRLCGQYPGQCNLEIGPPGVCQYDQQQEGYFCNNEPVIETRLTKVGLDILFPTCNSHAPPGN